MLSQSLRYLAALTTLALSILMTSGCKTVGRELASEVQPPFTYESSYNCQSSDGSAHRSGRVEESKTWSALSGMKIGPTQVQQFNNPNERILRPFVSDGCSMSPDGVPMTRDSDAWASCCVAHDVSYWLGGTEKERNDADRVFGRCIADRGYERTGNIYRQFVQKFGGPDGDMIFRWGYGWNYRRPYGSLTTDEVAQALALLASQEDHRDLELMKARLGAETRRLVRACDTFDRALSGFTRDDGIIYRELGAKLKKDGRAEWAKLEYFNRSKTVYLVKMERCDTPLEVTISKSSPRTAKVRGKCPEFLD